MPRSAPIRIMLADDHSIVRMGLASVLSFEPGMEIVAEAEDSAQAVQGYAEARPDVLLLDLRMPGGMDGIEALLQIREQWPEARVIVLTTSEFDEDVLRSMEGGAARRIETSASP